MVRFVYNGTDCRVLALSIDTIVFGLLDGKLQIQMGNRLRAIQVLPFHLDVFQEDAQVFSDPGG
jgi:hypothetical protein